MPTKMKGSQSDALSMQETEKPANQIPDVAANGQPVIAANRQSGNAANSQSDDIAENAVADADEIGAPAADDAESGAAPVRKRRRTRKRTPKLAADGDMRTDAEPSAGPEAEPSAETDGEPSAATAEPADPMAIPQELADSAFGRMNLSPEILAAVAAMGFRAPTAIQEETIPPMMDWRDVIAQAPTGTGKTVAFGIPIIEHFDRELADVQALILAPTRELALQITDELRALARNRPEIRIATIYGGQRIDTQLDALKHRPQVIVATPGRLIDHLNRRTVSLGSVRTVVLDEADRMLDMGFVRDVRKILDKMPRAWQVTMFSATMSRAVMDISWIYQRDVIELKVVPEAENKPQITQYSIEVGAHRRIEVIAEIMKKHNYQKAIVFCNRKHVTDYVARRLSACGVRAASIHGDIQQSTREKTLSSFRTGSLRVLVATDVASRGIDVEGVDAVFNYDIPDENEYYVHRIGRTGRARHEGVAYTFTTLMTQPKLDEIMRFTKCDIIPLQME